MLNQGINLGLMVEKKAPLIEIAEKAKKAAEVIAENPDVQEAIKKSAEKVAEYLFDLVTNNNSLKKKLKKLIKMHKKGMLDQDEYQKLKARVIEEAGAVDL